MRRSAALVLVSILLMSFGTGRASAEVSEVCQGRVIPLATDANGNPTEKLVEYHLYFHGERPAGNVDAAQELAELGASQHLTMNATAPTGTQNKVFLSNVGDGARWNTNYAMSPAFAHWTGQLPGDQRIVCAQANVHAQTSTGTLSAQLWSDAALAGTGPITEKPATGGTANQLSDYKVNFGKIDVTASLNLVVQVTSPANALVQYDSTTASGGLRYVTVEPI